MTLHDAHCHFLSTRFYEALGREKYGADGTVAAERVTGDLGWEAPGSADALAARWIAELDRNAVSRVGLIASVPGDEESVAAAVRRHPARFVGFLRAERRGGRRRGARAARPWRPGPALRVPVSRDAPIPPG